MHRTDLDDGVVDGDKSRHDVDDPLRVDDDAVSEQIVVEVLNGAELVQEAHSLSHLRRAYKTCY